MRADNNWEESVGKKLFDMEGEPAPQAWENISRRIAPKPKRKPFWYWLPALLLFLALPLAFYKGNFFTENEKQAEISNNSNVTATEKLAQNNPKNEAPQSPEKVTETERPETQTTEKPINSPKATVAENAIANAPKTQPKQAPNAVKPTVKILPGITKNTKQNQNENIEKTSTTRSKNQANGTVIIAQHKPKTNPETKEKTLSGNPEKPLQTALNKATKNAGTTAISEPEKPNDPKVKGSENRPVSVAQHNENVTPVISEKGQAVTPPATENQASEMAIAQAPDSVNLSADSVKVATVISADSSETSKNKERETKEKSWMWGVYGSGQYTFQRVFANPEDEIMILRMTNKNSLETERLGYEVGFRGYYPIQEKVQLEVGFQFARLNQYIKFKTANTIADSVTVTQTGNNLTLQISNREQDEILLFKYFFGGIYTGANVRLSNGLLLSGGLGANWLLWKNPDEDQVPIPTQSLNPYLSAGLRYQLPLSQKLRLQAGPTLQYYLRPVQKETAHYGAKPTTFGFTIGLLVK